MAPGDVINARLQVRTSMLIMGGMVIEIWEDVDQWQLVVGDSLVTGRLLYGIDGVNTPWDAAAAILYRKHYPGFRVDNYGLRVVNADKAPGEDGFVMSPVKVVEFNR